MNKMIRFWLCASVAACGQRAADESEVKSEAVKASTCEYSQLFGNAQHAGRACKEQIGLRVVAKIKQDSDVDKRLNTSGFLQIHEPPPLLSGPYLVVPTTHSFEEPTDFFQKSTTRYGLKTFKWTPAQDGSSEQLVPVWEAETDAVLVDGAFCSFGCQTNGYEQMFGPAIANGSVYAPDISGRLTRRELATGTLQAKINPLAGTPFDGDAVTTVNSPLTVAPNGAVLYTVVAWAANTVNRNLTPRGSWIVRVHPDDTYETVEWSHIATAAVGIPQFPNGQCSYQFGTSGTPGPTGPDSKAPQFSCGLQRPGLNVPVSIDHNGDLLVVSYANNQWAAAFVVRLDTHTFQPIVASDMRGHALHGCGVRLGPSFNDCRIPIKCDTITGGGTTHFGYDPCTNEPVPVFGPDLDSTAITVAINGHASWGSYDGGFVYGGDYDARGFGETFAPNGKFVANNPESYWDVTAAVRLDPTAPGGFVYVNERQLYSQFATDPLGIATYDATWKLRSIAGVPRDPDTDPNVTPVDFVAAQPLFDAFGTTYAPNVDGHLYKFSASGQVLEVVDLLDDTGNLNAISTLEGYGARDEKSRIIWSMGGYVYVIEGGATRLSHATKTANLTQIAKLRAGKQAKVMGVHNVAPPEPPELTH